MAIVGITLSASVDFQSSFDPNKGQKEATTFKLATLDSRIMGKLRDDATSFSVNPSAPEDEVDVSVGQNELFYLACQFGIKGWTNLKDEDGNDIRYRTRKRNVAGRSYEIVDDLVLGRIPQPVLVEIGQKIIELNDVSEEEAKN